MEKLASMEEWAAADSTHFSTFGQGSSGMDRRKRNFPRSKRFAEEAPNDLKNTERMHKYSSTETTRTPDEGDDMSLHEETFHAGANVAEDARGCASDARAEANKTKKERIKKILLQALLWDESCIEYQIHDFHVDAVRAAANVLMQKFAAEGNIHFTERCAQMVLKLGPSPMLARTLNIVLAACVKTGNLEKALFWWNRFKKMDVETTLVSYNTMINVCARSKDIVQAEWWMNKMLQDGIEPCLISFTTLISVCGKLGKMSKAEEWCEQMHRYGLRGDIKLHNAMIDVYVKTNSLQKAEMWFYKMQREGVAPNQRTFNMIIHVCAKTGDMVQAERWHKMMLDSGLRCDAYTYGPLIEGCAQCGDMDLAEYFLDRMFSEKAMPNIVCLRSLVKVYTPLQEYGRLATVLNKCITDGRVSRRAIQDALSSSDARFKSNTIWQIFKTSQP
eukprot:TRINITY_DN7883_c0_g1_i1.p1 TRINITY_DN7883_c0_g1~~TRINITY_DN7883_c0_g1_i1.p1  ORF type:complete len:446 (-),score=92.29 TRINITY_DN7883_c0_g1_i1:233-1570(-)